RPAGVCALTGPPRGDPVVSGLTARARAPARAGAVPTCVASCSPSTQTILRRTAHGRDGAASRAHRRNLLPGPDLYRHHRDESAGEAPAQAQASDSASGATRGARYAACVASGFRRPIRSTFRRERQAQPLARMSYRFAFAVLSLFFLGSTALWLRLDRSPPGWDDGYYLTNSLILYDALADGGIAGYARQFLTIMGIKPPLIAVLPTPVYLIAGRKSGAALAVNLGFLLVMFGALYWLGKKYAGRRAGLIAMYISGTIPMLYGPARWYLQE